MSEDAYEEEIGTAGSGELARDLEVRGAVTLGGEAYELEARGS